jgi:hypothetical protein
MRWGGLLSRRGLLERLDRRSCGGCVRVASVLVGRVSSIIMELVADYCFSLLSIFRLYD